MTIYPGRRHQYGGGKRICYGPEDELPGWFETRAECVPPVEPIQTEPEPVEIVVVVPAKRGRKPKVR